jgi:hypothetical protein
MNQTHRGQSNPNDFASERCNAKDSAFETVKSKDFDLGCRNAKSFAFATHTSEMFWTLCACADSFVCCLLCACADLNDVP